MRSPISSGSVEQLNVLIWGVRDVGVWGITLFKQYGDIVSLSIGSIRNYLLNDPILIEEILSKQNQNFTSRKP